MEGEVTEDIQFQEGSNPEEMTESDIPVAVANSDQEEQPEVNGEVNGDGEEGSGVVITPGSGVGNMGTPRIDRHNDIGFEGVANDEKVEDYVKAIKRTGVTPGEVSGKVESTEPEWANKDIKIDLDALESKNANVKSDDDEEDAPVSPPPEWKGKLKTSGRLHEIDAKGTQSGVSTAPWADKANQSATKFSDPEVTKAPVRSEAPSWASRSLRSAGDPEKTRTKVKTKAKTDIYNKKALRSTGVQLAEDGEEQQPSSDEEGAE